MVILVYDFCLFIIVDVGIGYGGDLYVCNLICCFVEVGVLGYYIED